jgi:FAD/FMN-containing dehydrogenase
VGAGRHVAVREPVLTRLCGWGRYPVVAARERYGEDLVATTHDAVLSRGLGRSYGDSSLPPAGGQRVSNSTLADRLLAFDGTTGIVRAEAGLALARLNGITLRRGWFTPITPGTQFVTLGGLVAADAHGKNHHVDGTFGRHVRRLRLRVADGRVLECAPTDEPELFWATLGGLGLTGHIVEVELTLKRVPAPWIWGETERASDLDALLDVLRRSSAAWPYTVGWLDASAGGRGIVTRGRWATPREAPPQPPRPKSRASVPDLFPSGLLRPRFVRGFNAAYYAWHGPGVHAGIVHPEAFFYPLDALEHWNRVYGRRGFTQYQCVLPNETPRALHHRLFACLRERAAVPYLGVVKDCGAQGDGLLSFPRPGITYALDLPIRTDTQQVVDALNELVIEAGGRVYLVKDAFTRAAHYRAMDPRVEAWNAVRRRWDPQARLRSAQSVRLFGDAP